MKTPNVSLILISMLLAAAALSGCGGEEENPAVELCEDGIHNGDETDVDCGGPDCPPCEDGLACLEDGDCASGNCEDEVCVPAVDEPSCDNEIKDGQETDVDCGGPDCPPCEVGLACVEDGDCASGNCEDEVCVPAVDEPSCDNEIKDGQETDVDCGGPDCPPCEDGLACIEDGDCASGNCEDEVCVPAVDEPSCDNEIKDGQETDVDCGGPDCPPCEDGLVCVEDGDCASGNCEDEVCVPAHSCDDGVMNGLETDVDCGGPDCPPCEDGLACIELTDCASGNCEDEICAPAHSCDDGVMNGSETDVDCGGPDCPPCEDGFACETNSDCKWMWCNGGICGGHLACMNGTRDGHETDVDCGGPFCHPCEAGKSCVLGRDCLSGNCNEGVCTPVMINTCDNEVQDGLETDVDCGGGLCPACPDGFACDTLLDCAGQLCEGGMCGGPWMCEDGEKNGRETDVDCGGGFCPPCAGGKSCLIDSDCLSYVCEDGVCAEEALTCDNGLQDGHESDIDCGGACPPCELGQKCNRPTDCASLACNDGICARNIVTIQAGEASVSCSTSGLVVLETNVSLDDVIVGSPILTLDDGRAAFWAAERRDDWLAHDDGRFAGIMVVAPAEQTAGLGEGSTVSLVADYVENDCHSELHVGPDGGLTQIEGVWGWPQETQEKASVLENGGSVETTEPYEGVLLNLDDIEVIDATGYDGPESFGSPNWWLKLEGDIYVANWYGLSNTLEVGDKLTYAKGVVVKHQGVYMLLPRQEWDLLKEWQW